MPVGWLSRRLNDYAKIPYKEAIWIGKNNKMYKHEYFKINEDMTNSLGAYIESNEPTFSKGHIEVYIWDITNALQMRLKNEAKEQAARDKRIKEIPQYYRKVFRQMKDITEILGNKIQYPSTVKLNEKENLKLVIKYIAPSEYRAVKELKSLEKILKTDKPANPLLENKNTILLLVGGLAAAYVIGHYVIHLF